MQGSNQFKEVTHCLCCGGKRLLPYLDLGEQPPCNWLRTEDQPKPGSFPLETFVCQTCWHSQLSVAVDPKVLFSNYTYRTGVSDTLCAHYDRLADDAIRIWEVINSMNQHPVKPTVLDIGCNDGTLLQSFHRKACSSAGVDPCDVPERFKMDRFMESPWNPEAQTWIGKVDIITATNVLAHNDYPRQFLELCKASLKERGVIVVEFPYARDLMKNCEFDTIYHEHLSYFNINSFAYLLSGTGLHIADVQLSEVHGGSIRFYLRHCRMFQEQLEHCRVARELILEEMRSGMQNLDEYAKFGASVNEKLMALGHVCDTAIKDGYQLVGFGASGKSTVMLNAIDHIDMQCIIDETPAKQGKLSPGRDIPIFPLERLRDEKRLAIVIMAWNCRQECIRKIKSVVLDDARIIDYVPEVKVSELY